MKKRKIQGNLRGLHCVILEGLMTQAGGWRLELKKFFSRISFYIQFSKKNYEKKFSKKGLRNKIVLAKKWGKNTLSW